MEFVFCINNCAKNFQVKYATCTLLNSALTWWKYHVKTVGIDVAYAMTWNELMKMMTEVYSPRNEIQKMENELWNLTVKDEEDKIERYISGLLDNIQGNVTSARTTRLQDTIGMANSLMDQKVRAIVKEDADNKRKCARIFRLCDKCKLHHHHGPCPVKCGNYKKVGHQARDCWTPTSVTCYRCGGKGPTKRYYTGPENQNGDEEAHQNLDIATGTFPLKNHYILVLTNASTNRSFVFTAISHLSDVASTLSVA
ncbi:reverse transcriptase domain-containing protein [Tanacetum coccineum]